MSFWIVPRAKDLNAGARSFLDNGNKTDKQSRPLFGCSSTDSTLITRIHADRANTLLMDMHVQALNRVGIGETANALQYQLDAAFSPSNL